MAIDHRTELRNIRTFPSLIKYLRDEMDWPIQSDDFEELTFEYTPDELGIDAASAANIQEIRRLRPAEPNQPWGIFFIKFEPKKLPVVALRRILSRVVLKNRASANSADRMAWQMSDLLFVSNYGTEDERSISLAYFTDDREMGDLPSLKVLGWDGEDTALHLDHVAQELRTKLRWPDDPADLDAWRSGWASAFSLGHREVITTSQRLADRLAELARGIRMRASEALAIETEKGPLRQLMAGFQKGLIHDLTEDGFADMYAQTVAYGLLSARISRPAGLVADNMADLVPITSPFLKDLMENFIRVGGRRKADEGGTGIDFDELGVNDVVQLLRNANMEAVLRDFGDRNPEEDPVIHFYENFLTAYDKKQKVSRGVFYTPQPVVSYIVRSVHELLQTEFGLTDGLADTTTWGEMLKKHPGLKLPPLTDEPGEKHTISPDEPFVQILDPATGTATFLVEVIDVIHRTLADKWEQHHLTAAEQCDAWNNYVPQHLLPRLHAYELMMAPYAIAHMKIGLKLSETGYDFGSDERARIYLTNALEPWAKQLPLIGFDALAHEAAAVNTIKRDKRFTVVIGNPPYSHLSSNLTLEAMAQVEPYKFINGERIQERGALSLQKNLQDDYVKFIRLAERTIEFGGYGIVGLITNNSYLDGRSFRGMRLHLSQTFHRGWILDLHGSGKKNEAAGDVEERDVNVFDIMQGVAIALWARTITKVNDQISRSDLLGGQDRKFQFLATETVTTTSWKQIQLAPPFFPFVKQDMQLLNEYQTYMSLREIFPVYSSGIKTHRDNFAFSFTVPEMEEKLRQFCDKNIIDQDLRDGYGLKDTNVWSLRVRRAAAKLPALVREITRAQYRPFDARYTCYSDEIIELSRRAVMTQMIETGNLALLCCQQQAEEGFQHVFCTRIISECCAVSNRTRETTSAFPLWLNRPVGKSLNQQELKLENGPHLNINPIWLNASGSGEEIFHYVYSLLHSTSYRARYAGFLRSDFPRLPMTGNLDMFRTLARLGGELTALHLIESPKLSNPITMLIGGRNPVVEKISWSRDTVWVDKAQTTGFQGVPEDVWNFRIGGYQVCEKWLKDRGPKKGRPGRILTDEDLDHYQRVVVALNETIRVMAEIDEVIEQYGGWPGAFKAADKGADN